jgi:fumarylacetoacetate (FAA) hydrolase family protein
MAPLTMKNMLPADWRKSVLVGRIWLPGPNGGPTPVVLFEGTLYDVSRFFSTTSDLLNTSNPLRVIRLAIESGAPEVPQLPQIIANSDYRLRVEHYPYFLCPIDLQAIKAAGVTFVSSMVERVIEEHARGDLKVAEAIRNRIGQEIGGSIENVVPGSTAASKLKKSLQARGLWSQYLEVGIGPDAEVFTKAQPLSAVGSGAQIGIRADSKWNNPEPELVLAVNRAGTVVGATLGNDVNLRDFEGRSALLLGKAKDNNASCAIGPFVRIFNRSFSLSQALRSKIRVSVDGMDGFKLRGSSDVSQISRSPLEIIKQTINRTHQYPDGVVLFLGTQFAPTKDRGEKGKGFSHKVGDVVRIGSDQLGVLVNEVAQSNKVTPWTYGIADLMRNLASRDLL